MTRFARPACIGIAVLAAACSPTDPSPRAPDFSACPPDAVVPLDSVPDRHAHPAFAMLRPVDLGDSLAALDHGIVVGDDGRLHCFWTRGRDWLDGEGVDFGHASSADLVHWELHAPLRPTGADPRIDRAWSPHVVREDGEWWMYFTGVDLPTRPGANVQRIFASRSSDLFAWSEPELVLEPRHPRLAWGDAVDWANDARDPVLYRHDGALEMLLTVRLVGGDQSLARARREGGIWQVVDVLESIRGRVIESAAIHSHDGEVWVFVNNWLDGGQSAWVGPGLAGPFARRPGKIRGFALEFLHLPGGILLASRVWGSSVLFTSLELPGLGATNMVFPDCYTGDRPLLQPGDHLAVLGAGP